MSVGVFVTRKEARDETFILIFESIWAIFQARFTKIIAYFTIWFFMQKYEKEPERNVRALL